MNPLEKRKLNGLLLGTSCLFASAFMVTLPALANPTGGTVVSGHDTISSKGKTTTVDQTSEKGFIDWNSFSIGKGQTVQFVQPGKGSVTVNRVTGGDPSKILGDLLATGGVWIINGNGILFGKGSIVNVGSLIATTSDLGDDDFKNGKYRFKKGSNPNASVINQGTITASKGGSIVLSAAHVANEGVIQANLGKVVLGGAAAFTVDLNGDNLIRYQINKPVSQTPTKSDGDPRSALVSNSGTIEANGGEVLMTSRAASNVQDNVINNSGIVEATSVHAHDGEVDLDAGDGTVKDSGTVDVSGTQAGQTGGDVSITGRKIVVADGARIDAQGANGGGTVLIGGDFHGQGPLRQAHKVVIGKAVIDVDATHKGDGGKVAIWSKGDTSLDGRISARGGRKGGNGGYVETSGHELGMDASALVDTSAIKGISGTWLLDPTDVVIDNCGANCSAGNIDATAIGNSLSAGTNVTVEAVGTGAGTGNISVDASVTADGAGTLSLLATYNIDIEDGIQNAGSGGINLVAGWDGTTGISGNATTGESGSSINIGAITSTPGAYGKNGGSVTIGDSYSSASISVGSAGGTTTVAASGLTVGVGGNVTANAQLGYAGTGGGGDINVVLSGDLTIQSDDGGTSRIGNTGTSGAVTGNITIAADNLTLEANSHSYGQAVIGNAGTGAVSGNIAITTSGDVSMDAGDESEKYASTVTIGNETTSAAGASGNIRVAVGGGLSMYANFGSTARIGSDSSTTNINVTVAGGITMQAGYGCEDCSDALIHQSSERSTYSSTVQIGNFGNGSSTVGGNISVTSTGGNITLTAQSGYVEIGNSGGLHVSGDVSVVAANGAIALNSYYGYSQIGNAGGGSAGTVTGNITVFAETGLSLYASYSVSHLQIGNDGYTGSGATVSGDIFISAFGGTTINGQGGTTAWIGNIGDTEIGDVTLVTGSLVVEQGGDQDSATFGNMVASDLTGANITATAGTGGSGGGNVTIAIESNVTTDWGTLFGNGLDFANGNTLSLITTGAQTVSTSIQATENGNINLIAGWDGTTGYGPRSIIISDIFSTPAAYGRAGGNISIGGTGDVVVGTALGNTTVAGANIGVASLGAAQAVIGIEGSSSGNVTVDATGNVTVSTPNGGTAQIGNGGASDVGDVGGNITINAAGNVDLTAIEGNVQIGNGGANANGNFSGNIDIVAVGAIVIEGGGTNGDAGYAQIGNGGSGSNNGTGAGSDSGNITVQGTSVSLEAGSGSGSYVQIGHGGAGSDQESGAGTTGNISVVATDGDVVLQGGSMGDTGAEQNDYAQIGMGGPFSGADTSNKDTGNITVHASGNISILGGTDADQQNGFAIIGDTGTANKTGNITVSAGGNITLTGGSATGDPDFGGLSNSFALIGDDNAGSITGNIKVTAGGNLTLTGGGTGSTGDMAQIGDISANSDVTGNLNVSVGGTLSFTSTGDPALIADLASGTASGTTLIKTADIDLTSDFYGDFGQSLGDDLGNGNTTLEITDSTADTVIAGAINASSANTLKILDTGSLHIQSGIQNSGSGAIYVVAGWDGTTTSAGSLTNAGVYGNNAGSITVGDVLGDVAVGSHSGTTTFAAANVTVDAAQGLAQIGWDGTGGGNIAVLATGNVTVETGANVTAMIGNGGAGVTGAITGNIAITTAGGALTLSAPGDGATAEVGDLSDGASSEDSNITIDTNGGAISLASGGSFSYAQIGNWENASNTGILTGNITINAGAVTLNANGTDSSSQIGNGNYLGFANNGAVGGNIDIHATTLTVEETAPQGGFEEARIGNLGDGVVTGNVDVTTTGNILISADGDGAASIGDFSSLFYCSTDDCSNGQGYVNAQGQASGTVDVKSGGNISVSSTGLGSFASIELGGATAGTVDVTAIGNITASADDGAGVLIGAAESDNGGAKVTVTSTTGNIDIISDGSATSGNNGNQTTVYSNAQIGNVEADNADTGGNVNGNITLEAASGDITISTDGGAAAQIGNLNTADTVTGDLTIVAGNTFDIDGANVAIGNTGPGETGNVTITAVSLVGDISPSIGNDLPGGDFTLTLTGDDTLTLATAEDYSGNHTLSITNAGDIVFDASLQNNGSGTLDVTSTEGNILIGGANATGNVAVGSGGTNVFSADNVTLDAVNGYAQLGYHGNRSGNISVNASGAVTLAGGSSRVAQIGDGANLDTSDAGGNVSIAAASLKASGKSDIAGHSADIALSGHNNVGSASHPLDFAVNDLAIQTNGGNVFATSSTQGVSLGVGSDGIDLNGGDFSLAANGSVMQTQAILAGAIDIAGSTIALLNAGNAFGDVTLDASGNASVFDTRNLIVASAVSGGTLSLSSHGNISQTGAITAVALNATASHGAITLTNAGNNFANATLNASGNASLFDAADLTISSADVGGTVTLSSGGNIDQSGAIDARSLDATTNHGVIVLTNTGNNFASASLTSLGNASLYDASDLVLTGADVGNTLSLTSGGDISQTGAITAKSLDVTANGITLTNAGNSFGNAMIDASGNASLFDASDLTISGADVGGTLTLSSGGNIGQSGAITADALNATASQGSIALTDSSNDIAAASLTASGNAALSDSSSLTITGANIGGALTLVDAHSVSQTGAIAAKSLDVTANAITLTDSANAIGEAKLSASGNAALSDSSNLTISGADVGGTLTLTDAGTISQSGAIIANALDATAKHIVLADSGNEVGSADLSASSDATLSDASDLTITGANVGGTLTLTDTGSIDQSGAITAKVLDVTAADIALTDSGNAVQSALLASSGSASLADADNLTVTGASVGGTLTLTDAGSITQTGAISAKALDAKAKHITLTNAGNSFSSAEIDATDDASVFDASGVVVSGADVGGTFTLSSGGDIGQSGAITAGTLDATADHGAIALINSGNAIGDVSLTSSGDAAVYDSTSMTLQNASVGGNLTLLTEGSLTFDSSVQLNNGNILAVAGWDGTTTGTSALTDAGAYGNNGGSIVVGGTGASGDVAVGSAKGSTTLAGANVSLDADNGYAQVGYHGSASGALEVLAMQAVTLSGGAGAGDYAQIGNGGMDTSGNESGNITVKAGGAVTLDGGNGADAYAQIGHGGADADKDSSGYTNTGTITVQGQTVALVAGAGEQSYTQIGQGGFDLGDGLTGKGENQGDVDVTAADGVTLTGNGADAYAQIGNGGDHVNANAASSASGSNTGSVTVDGGSGAVTMTAGVDASSYVQIGNGGFDVNAGDNPSNFSDSGTIMVSDLTLLGSNSGMDGYAQVGNGDASDNGVGDASGNITVSAGKIVLTDGRAKDSPALIGNQTGAGSISGTITGYTPPPPPPPPPDNTNPTAPVIGAIETTIQSQTGEPVDVIIAPPEDLPPPYGDGAPPQLTGPLAQLTGDDGQAPDGVDIATDELGQSLDGNKDVQSVSIIPGVLTEVVYSETPHGIPPANQDFSSWGNEALWRW